MNVSEMQREEGRKGSGEVVTEERTRLIEAVTGKGFNRVLTHDVT